jgi:hypothetical protein
VKILKFLKSGLPRVGIYIANYVEFGTQYERHSAPPRPSPAAQNILDRVEGDVDANQEEIRFDPARSAVVQLPPVEFFPLREALRSFPFHILFWRRANTFSVGVLA